MIFDLLTRLCSEQTSVTTQNISRFTNCNNLNIITDNTVIKQQRETLCVVCH